MEWFIPDRRLVVPPELSITTAADFLVKQTSCYPGLTLTFDQAARDMFDSYQVTFNVRCTLQRKRQDADAAAEEGAMHVVSWTYHIGMSLLYMIYIYIYMNMLLCIGADSSLAYIHFGVYS